MSPLELLKAARVLISDEKNWCQGTYARTIDGRVVDYSAPSAHRFCAVGAFERAGVNSNASEDVRDAAKQKLYRAANKLGYEGVVQLNDTRTHSEVLRLYDAALASLQPVENAN